MVTGITHRSTEDIYSDQKPFAGTEFEEEIEGDEQKKTSSIETILSLVNQMMGGTMLVLPILFGSNGLIGATINMLVSGVIACKTCTIYIDHLKPKEQDYNESIIRILGKNYELLYRISKCAYLLLLTLTYFLLITVQLYLVVVFVIAVSTDDTDGVNPYYVQPDADNKFVFNKFSIPYMSIVVFAFTLFISFQKNMLIFIKISSYGSLTVMFFTVFIFYIFFDNITSNAEFSTEFKKQKMFSWDIGTLAGTAALAYAVHVNSATTLKSNRDQTKNKRDMIWVFVISGSLYILIGLLGCIGIVGNCNKNDGETQETQEPAIINDCFPTTNIANILVVLIYLFNIISAFPIYYGIMKSSFFNLFMMGQVPSKRQDAIFNVFYLFICFIVNNTPLEPDFIMALNGSICCFFYVYVIPIALHMQCYHGDNKIINKIKKSMSVIGILKDDKDREKLKLENYQYRQRFISTKPIDNKVPLLAEDVSEKQKDTYYQMRSQQRRYSTYERVRKESRKLGSTTDTQLPLQHQIKNQIPQEDKKLDKEQGLQGQIASIESQNQELSTKQSQIHDEEQIEDDNLSNFSFESCNDHSQSEGTGKIPRLIVYTLIGIMGLFILFYELFIVIQSIFGF